MTDPTPDVKVIHPHAESVSFARAVGELTSEVKAMKKKVDDIHRTMYTSEPPLVTRVDRLEVSDRRRRKWVGAAVTAAISGAVMTAWAYFRGVMHIG